MPCDMMPLTTVSPYKLLTLSQFELRIPLGHDSWRLTTVAFEYTLTQDSWNLCLWNNRRGRTHVLQCKRNAVPINNDKMCYRQRTWVSVLLVIASLPRGRSITHWVAVVGASS